ncbi:hypothetical protein F5B22DRAFT_573457 [Xylaria bambusicola]|uniref:uncharacterized protein n=1 Tax=Xylaria bambusicola TaxID=326684 RepID=UPI0020085F3B|nr:uncharacterized protein F5B22DRAFT_573457 [Xylaria bambusicola]KAI0521446.1 hypothetical protein F5B22DRAFT_573457 [Xylaria bambusicola]
MLEKTAACLEPCGRRVVPPPRTALRSTRQLHTAFWQHGAADIELTKAWQTLMHGTLDSSVTLSDRGETSSLNASAFLLDFLYPAGTAALLRRPSPISLDQSERLRMRTRPSHVSPRLYNSESHSSPAARGTNSATAVDHEISNDVPEPSGPLSAEPSDSKPSTSPDKQYQRIAIDHILKTNNFAEVDVLWRRYTSLSEHSQKAYSQRVLSFLSRTGRVSDSRKISELFHKLELSSWDNEVFVAGVSAEINLQNLSQALSIFEKGLQSSSLDNTALIDSLDLLLASALRSSTTSFLEKVWQRYPDMAARWDFNGIAANLTHCASVPGIAEKVMMFPEYVAQRLSASHNNDFDREALEVLQRILVRRALVSCEHSHVIPLLLLTKDPLAFEDFLRSAEKTGRRKVAPDVYDIYRKLPGSSPSHAVLHCVFHAYTQMRNSYAKMHAGVEMLWKDWHGFHGMPSRRAYQKHLGFYATRGDKERVYSLWTEYVERFRNDPTINIFDADQGSDTFAHLLHVHAVNAEPEEAQRIFNDMMNKFKIQPSIYDWNILLNAYAQADDYGGAMTTFDRLCQTITPDKFSYGTLMQMAGSRGDLAFTVDLYRRARSSNVVTNDAMLSSLVDAYCQNDLFKEAEDVCTRASTKGIATTLMWNKLLYYNALRRDLANINRILNSMADKNIPYNQFTYQQLLLGLALCRQPHHALTLLTVALKEKVFEVTPAHFQIVMSALLLTREPVMTRRLCLLMNEHKIPITEGVIFRLSQSLGQWKKLPPKQRRKRSETQWYGDALRTFFNIYGYNSNTQIKHQGPSSAKPVRQRELLRSGREVYQFSTMMYIFAQLNNSVQVNELVELYRYVFQGPNNEGILPLGMLNAVMLSGLQDQRYDRVKSTWRLIFDIARTEARAADFREDLPYANKISPKYHYALSGCLRVMQEVLFKENNPLALQELVKEVREAGFEIDSKNWNYHVQSLVQMKQYKAAFAVCEKYLMPNWTGWQTVRAKEAIRTTLPLETRRKGLSRRYLRPTATTLYRLAQAYLELDRLGPWSSEAIITLRDIESDSIQVVRAIKSMIRVYSSLEYEIFSAVDSIDTTYADEPNLEEEMTGLE